MTTSCTEPVSHWVIITTLVAIGLTALVVWGLERHYSQKRKVIEVQKEEKIQLEYDKQKAILQEMIQKKNQS